MLFLHKHTFCIYQCNYWAEFPELFCPQNVDESACDGLNCFLYGWLLPTLVTILQTIFVGLSPHPASWWLNFLSTLCFALRTLWCYLWTCRVCQPLIISNLMIYNYTTTLVACMAHYLVSWYNDPSWFSTLVASLHFVAVRHNYVTWWLAWLCVIHLSTASQMWLNFGKSPL